LQHGTDAFIKSVEIENAIADLLPAVGGYEIAQIPLKNILEICTKISS
jgi:hypothetical protein